MHHIVDMAAFWESELVCHNAHPASDHIWPVELETELLCAPASNGRLHIRLESQIDPVSFLEGALAAVLIRLLAHALLGTQ
jgi:hypothetical protein